jgi:hypothetical protein
MTVGAELQNKTCGWSATEVSGEKAIACRHDASLERLEVFAVDLVFVFEPTNILLIVSELEGNVVLGLNIRGGLMCFVIGRRSHDPVVDVLTTEMGIHQENSVRDSKNGSSLCMESGRFLSQEELDGGCHAAAGVFSRQTFERSLQETPHYIEIQREWARKKQESIIKIQGKRASPLTENSHLSWAMSGASAEDIPKSVSRSI